MGAVIQATGGSSKLGAHASDANVSMTPSKPAGHTADANASMMLSKTAVARAGMQTQFAWMRVLTREQQQCLRQCQSPHAARKMLAAMHETESITDRSPIAPVGLLEDLQKHLRTTQVQLMDLEEELARQASVHQAEIAALNDEHYKACRREKLELLARFAPDQNAGMEALACDAVRPALGPTVAALANSPYKVSTIAVPHRSRSSGNSKDGPSVAALANSPYTVSTNGAPHRSRSSASIRDDHTPRAGAAYVAFNSEDAWNNCQPSDKMAGARNGLKAMTVTQPRVASTIAPPTVAAVMTPATATTVATESVCVA